MRSWGKFCVGAIACWGVLFECGGGSALAQEEAVLVESRFPGWGHAPLVGGGVYGGDGNQQQNVFAVIPLWAPVLEEAANAGTLWFVQPQAARWGGDEWFASVGLGFRHLFAPAEAAAERHGLTRLLSEGWFVGANAFFDMAHSANGNDYFQAGLGFELGSRYLTLRGNYYLPDSGRHQYASRTTVQPLSSRVQSKDRYSLDVQPEGNGISDIGIVWDRQTQIRQRSLLTTIDSYETALQGWNLEVMTMVPKLERYVDLRLIAGLYDYEGGVSGGRLGLELRPVPALVLSAMWMEDGRGAGGRGHWLAGVGVQMPLGAKPKTQLTPRSRSLKERLLEPVARQSQLMLGDEEEISQRVVEQVSNRREGGRFEAFTTPSYAPGSYLATIGPDGKGIAFEVQADGSLKQVPFRDPYYYVIPEPSRVLLLILGLLCLALRRWRR